RFAPWAQAFLGGPNVTQEGKGFSASALKVDGRIFAMLSSRSEFVVKLPRKRVVELIDSGDGRTFNAGKGRPMTEWLILPPMSRRDWTSVAEEGFAFVGGASTRT